MTRSLMVLGAALALAAAAPAEPADSERARALFAEIRCVVCQNESIDSSQAEIAADLRGVIREQIAAGRSDQEIRRFLVARYGEFVLFRPAFSAGNAVLWLTPFALMGGGLLVIAVRARRAPPVAPLSPEEAAQAYGLDPPEQNNRNGT